MKKHSLISSAAILSFVNIILRLSGFGLRVWLANRLGAQGMALYQLVFPVFSLMMTVATGGLPTALSRIAAADEGGSHAALRSTLRLSLTLSVPLLIAAGVCAPLICTYVLGQSSTLLPFLIMLPCVACASACSIYSGYFYGRGNVLPGAVSQLTEQAVRIGACILLFSLFPSAEPSCAAALAMGGMLLGDVSSLLCVRAFYRKPESIGFMRGPSRLLTDSAPVTLLRLFGSAVSSFTSVILPGRLIASGLSNEAALEGFAVMTGMAQPLVFMGCMVTGALGTALIPSLSADMARGNSHTAKRKISLSLLLCGGFSLLCAFGLYALAPQLSILLYSRTDVGGYLRMLAPLVVLASMGNLTSSVLHGLGAQKYTLRNHLIGAIPSVIGVLLCAVPNIRLAGYAVGHCIGDAVCLVLNLCCIRKRLPK